MFQKGIARHIKTPSPLFPYARNTSQNPPRRISVLFIIQKERSSSKDRMWYQDDNPNIRTGRNSMQMPQYVYKQNTSRSTKQ